MLFNWVIRIVFCCFIDFLLIVVSVVGINSELS